MMEQKKRHVISRVLPGSIAEELEIEPGDCLLAVNQEPLEDVFDYRYRMNDEYVDLLIEKPDGEQWELEVEKEYSEDLGLEFENGLMDDYRSCTNHCIFCFIDQMPKGMRETLYFKDDDSRLSFLQGNYVTLTNMSDHDIERIIAYHMEPINISFQTMDPALRCRMLHNRFAGDALKKADRLYEAGIHMNGQIVLCKGYNDKEQLAFSIEELSKYAPVLESVSIVPVGLTRYREGLCHLEPFDREDARDLLAYVHDFQQKMLRKHGIHFVHASDEWYILAGEPLPEEERYDGYLQLENGVGMLRLLDQEFKEALKKYTAGQKKTGRTQTGRRQTRTRDMAAKQEKQIRATVATGLLAAPFIEKHMKALSEEFPGVQVQVIPVKNHFFGESITVSGLITGQDLIGQLKDRDLGEKLLIPCSMLRQGEDVFLDDVSVEDLKKAVGVPVVVVDTGGEDLLNAVLDPPGNKKMKRRQIYEQTGSGHSGQA